MKFVVMMIVAMLFSVSANATEQHKPKPKPVPTKSKIYTNSATAASTSKAVAIGAAVSGSTSSATGGNVGDVNVNVGSSGTGAPAPDSITVKDTPALAGMATYSTANCMVASGATLSVPGFGVGGTTALRDDNCAKIVLSDHFMRLGLRDDALAVACASDFADLAPSCAKYIKKAADKKAEVLETEFNGVKYSRASTESPWAVSR